MTAQLRVEHRLQAVALGQVAPEAVVEGNGKTDLAAASAEYLRDIASARSKETSNAYRRYVTADHTGRRKNILTTSDM